MITRSFLQSHEDQEPFIFSEDLDEQNDGFQELSQEDEPLESRSDLISIQKKIFSILFSARLALCSSYHSLSLVGDKT